MNKKKRLTHLAAIYRSAIVMDDMDHKFLIEDADGVIDNLFDYQYLSEAGYIETVIDDDGKHCAVITFDGVVCVEEFMDSITSDIDAIDFIGTVNNLVLDKINRNLDVMLSDKK